MSENGESKMQFVSEAHTEWRELCAASVSEQLPLADEIRLRNHLRGCHDCRQALDEYKELRRNLLPDSLPDELLQEYEPLAPSYEVQEMQLQRVIAECPGTSALGARHSENGKRADTGVLNGFHWRGLVTGLPPVALASAAGVLLLAIFFSGYRLGTLRSTQSSRERGSPHEAPTVVPPSMESHMRDLTLRGEMLQQMLREKDERIAGLSADLRKQQVTVAEIRKQQGELVVGSSRTQEQNKVLAAERETLQSRLSRAVEDATALRTSLEDLRGQREDVSTQIAALDAENAQLKRLLAERERTIDQDRQLLSSDRDIRDLIGARDLLITEVHDVGRGGKTEKPFARVFYTKGKSLIFYAYDLDCQTALKNASAFQAWGVRDGRESKPKSLGIFYVDNLANKRWALRVDDPRALEEINAVFVTAEPTGGSAMPSGKQLLFADLRVLPNHP